jgi:HSP20 family protein
MGDIPVSKGQQGIPSLIERMDQMARAMGGSQPDSAGGVWHPRVDVYRREGQFVVQLELPGMKGQKMAVMLAEDHLVIEGERSRPDDLEGAGIYYCERSMGDFHRVIHLPAGLDESAVEASYEDGILTVILPEAARHRARRIEIT